jgi:hypothetical protein
MISRARWRTAASRLPKETAMGGEAHRRDRHAGFQHGGDQRGALRRAPVETRQPLVGLIHRHLDEIETAAFRQHQPLRPAEIFRQRFLIDP